jgi:hypothetical protein
MAVQVERTNAESNLACASRSYFQTRVYGICAVGSVNAAREDVHVTSGLMVTNDDGTAELHIEGIFNTRYKHNSAHEQIQKVCHFAGKTRLLSITLQQRKQVPHGLFEVVADQNQDYLRH